MLVKLSVAVMAIGLFSGYGNAASELELGFYEQHFQNELIVKRPGHAPETEQPSMAAQRLCIERITPDHPETFLALPDGVECTFDKAVWAEGRADIAGSCLAGDGGPPFKTSITGSYQRTAFDVALRMVTEIPEVAVDVTLKITARRVGDCPAKDGR
jgi:hypothetical protein